MVMTHIHQFLKRENNDNGVQLLAISLDEEMESFICFNKLVVIFGLEKVHKKKTLAVHRDTTHYNGFQSVTVSDN